ncbi:HEAT repeat domain-containing protein [Paractinoplanes deccanensis]|uniref:HEAT repeat domain-containing protein n=1 Tax=Paractinoplanes deccanensis TaxID=113561 RepID=UPI001940607F|nr:HEAT repeat domain-containing protein [Actinoplanes deccanensis]
MLTLDELFAHEDPWPIALEAGLSSLGEVYRPGLEDLMRQALSDPDASLRREAFSGLPGDSGALELVIEGLRDPDEWIRREAVIRLGWSATREDARDDAPEGPSTARSIAHLLIPLVKDPSPVVRSTIGQVIGRLYAGRDDQEEAVHILLGLLAEDDPQTRARAAQAIA